MASTSEKATLVSGGVTLFGGAIVAGLRLAFPDMIVPFGWALALAVLGAFGLLATIVFGIIWALSGTNDRSAYVKGLQERLVLHLTHDRALRGAETDEAFNEARTRYLKFVKETVFWLVENMGQAAGAKYAHGNFQALNFPWPGEHNRDVVRERQNTLGHISMRIQNIHDLLASDQWDDPMPLKKRKKTAAWKVQNQLIRGKLEA